MLSVVRINVPSLKFIWQLIVDCERFSLKNFVKKLEFHSEKTVWKASTKSLGEYLNFGLNFKKLLLFISLSFLFKIFE